MSIARMPVIKEWLESWMLLGRNTTFVLASGLVDIVFFIAYGFLTAPVFDKLTEHVIVIGTLVSEQMRVAAGRARPAVIDTLFQQPVSQYTWQFVGLLIVLVLVVFVLFCVFQGLNWWLATSVIGKKQQWRDFLLRFARVNLLWFGLYVVWYCIDTVFDLRRIVVEKATGQAAGAAPMIALSFALIVIAYFALISYPLLNIRKAFLIGIRHAAVLVPGVLLAGAQFLAGNFALRWLATVNATAHFILGAVLLLVLLAWTRIFMTRLAQRVA